MEWQTTGRVALILAIVMLSATGFSALRIGAVVNDSERERFGNRVQEAQLSLERRLAGHAEALYGARGLFDGGSRVTRSEWRDYVRSTDLPKRFPALVTLAFNRVIRPGSPRRGSRRFALVIDYMHPAAAGAAGVPGVDVMTDPVRREAVMRATDSGRPTATGPIELLHARSDGRGFALLLPVYRRQAEPRTVAQRRRALIGTVAAVFRVSDFLREALAYPEQHLDVVVRDTGVAGAVPHGRRMHVLYESESAGEDAAVPARRRATVALDVGGRRWVASYAAPAPLVSDLERGMAVFVLVGGIAVSLLVVALVLALGGPGGRRLGGPADTETGRGPELRSALTRIADTGSRATYAGVVLAIAAAYLATAKVGLLLADYGGAVTPVWPPTGIAIAALLLLGRRFWPGVALGAFTANALTGIPLGSAVGIASGNTLEAVVAVLLLTSLTGFRPSLARVRDVLSLVALGAVLATTVSATVGVTSLWLGGVVPVHDLGPAWRLWWIGDALGALIVAPILMIAATRRRSERWSFDVPTELAVLGALAAVGLIGIAGGVRSLFVLFPLLVWAAFRFRQPGAALANLAVGAIGIWDALDQSGASSADGLIESQAFLGIAAVTSLLLAALASELEHASTGLASSAASERQLRELLDSAPDAMVIVDSEGEIILVNAQAETMFGYKREELLGQPVERLMPERLRTRHERHRTAYGESPQTRAMGEGRELNGRRKDGSEFPVEISLSPLEIDGRVLVSSAIRDISERKVAQDALSQAEERFRTAFEDAPIGMALITLDGNIAQVNRALATITRSPAEELVGRHVGELTHPSDAGAELIRLNELAGGDADTYQLEKRFLPADGEHVWVAVSTSLVRDPSGRPRHLISQYQDITERRKFESQLQFLADHDPLTQLFNRRRFEEELDGLLRHVRRYRESAAMLMIDVDNFKDINDTLGHRAGDEVIQAVGRAVRGRLRETDVLARLGGDEFAVLLHEAGADEAVAVADGLLDAIRACGVPGGPPGLRLTASIGITLLDAGHRATADDLLVEADLAMYEAKDAGRDGRILYEPGGAHEVAMRARLTWGDRLRTAIENDHFELDRQPILDLADDEVRHHELLIRLRLDTGERIAPAEFLSRAERFGLIRDVDRWVLREAVGLLAHTPAEERLAVNLSAQSVTDPGLPGFLRRELAQRGVDPGRLILEITETDAIARMDEARRLVAEVADLGCTFALDDFGAGFGSFYYLKHLPFDFLKIDGEFIHKLTTSRTDQLIVGSLVETAQGLGMRTIAEYVGDEETLELVRMLGVDFAQGFHVGRPAPLPRMPVARAS